MTTGSQASQEGGPPAHFFCLVKMHESVVQQVWHLAEPLVSQEGMEIVDVEFRRENHGMVLRLYIDRDGGVNLDALSRVSRQLGDVLDANEAVPGKYTLEVSSPGIYRRLRRPDHFARYIGKRVRIRAVAPLEGRRSFLGTLIAVDSEAVDVAEAGGTYRIRFADIAQANYEPETLGKV